jgi:predicted ATP-dependent Lon-type protease
LYIKEKEMNRPPGGIDRVSISTLTAEAESKATDFNATERSAFIRKTVHQVKAMAANGYTKDSIKEVFPEFAEDYPGLFEMVLRPGGYDERSYNLMIQMLDKMGSGKTTQHQASIKVGQHLMDAYVTPNLPPVPTSTTNTSNA